MFSDTASAPPADLIKEGSDATFMADVVEASRVQPVIVDFWATWCGPCRTLTPLLENAVKAARGAVKLVKIDVDKNPAYAGCAWSMAANTRAGRCAPSRFVPR